MTQIAGKNVLVTGGASGIGRQIALELARRGGNIVLWDIDPKKLDRVLAEVAAVARRKPHGYLCNVADRDEVYRIATSVNSEVGAIDILINNAGVVSGKRFLDLPDDKIEATFRVNTLALFWTTKAFLPSMIERNQGHVVNIASAAGLIGVSRLTDYSASKWAVVGFDESLRVELRQTAPRVRTTIVCPYFINTGMFDGVKSRFSFLLPILEEQAVAARIADAIGRNRPRLWLPPIVYTVPPLRALPVWLFDSIANVLGINVSMEEFRGRATAPRQRRRKIRSTR
ncbi:MAG: SDR family oxidoreductase [Deltaproteobacteria bacterium]|nr:SDR family oxidoreductase [Deltaproteobacteria bacterium]